MGPLTLPGLDGPGVKWFEKNAERAERAETADAEYAEGAERAETAVAEAAESAERLEATLAGGHSRGAALGQGNPAAVAGPRVLGLRPDDAILLALLEGVGDPAAHAAHGEDRREERGVDAEAVQHQRRIELHVGLEAPPGLVFLQQPERRGFDRPRQCVEGEIA